MKADEMMAKGAQIYETCSDLAKALRNFDTNVANELDRLDNDAESLDRVGAFSGPMYLEFYKKLKEKVDSVKDNLDSMEEVCRKLDEHAKEFELEYDLLHGIIGN